MERLDHLTTDLRRICADLKIASMHLYEVIPDIEREYDFSITDLITNMHNTLDDYYLTLGELIIKRRVKDGQ